MTAQVSTRPRQASPHVQIWSQQHNSLPPFSLFPAPPPLPVVACWNIQLQSRRATVTVAFLRSVRLID